MTKLSTLCKIPVQIASREMTITAAAQRMREGHAGALVVVDDDAVSPKPIGIVTDRDIVVAIVALDLDPNVFLLDDLLNRTLVVAKGDQDIREALALMNSKGVRRLPVVNKAGVLMGIVALDDLIAEIARDLTQVTSVIEREITTELELRPARIRARKAKSARKREN
ncbi:MAG: CBS domain-containing protein [Betaproteobacteria bacterium]